MISPCLFTTSAASGFKIGLVQSPTSWLMLPVPLRRDRFTTEVGPDGSGSKPGIEGCNHLPEISGIDAPLSLPLLADPTVGATGCPRTGAAVAAASVTTKRKSLRTFLTTPR